MSRSPLQHGLGHRRWLVWAIVFGALGIVFLASGTAALDAPGGAPEWLQRYNAHEGVRRLFRGLELVAVVSVAVLVVLAAVSEVANKRHRLGRRR